MFTAFLASLFVLIHPTQGNWLWKDVIYTSRQQQAQRGDGPAFYHYYKFTLCDNLLDYRYMLITAASLEDPTFSGNNVVLFEVTATQQNNIPVWNKESLIVGTNYQGNSRGVYNVTGGQPIKIDIGEIYRNTSSMSYFFRVQYRGLQEKTQYEILVNLTSDDSWVTPYNWNYVYGEFKEITTKIQFKYFKEYRTIQFQTTNRYSPSSVYGTKFSFCESIAGFQPVGAKFKVASMDGTWSRFGLLVCCNDNQQCISQSPYNIPKMEYSAGMSYFEIKTYATDYNKLCRSSVALNNSVVYASVYGMAPTTVPPRVSNGLLTVCLIAPDGFDNYSQDC